MARLTGQYSANRSVREYVENFYLPAADSYGKRTRNSGELAAQILKWQEELRAHWSEVGIQGVDLTQEEGHFLFQAYVCLGAIPPEHIRVEVFADSAAGAPFIAEMYRPSEPVDVNGGFLYRVEFSDSRPASDYTVRIVGALDTLAVPLEEPLVLWQR
jgi:starch phosphorylase